MRISIKYDDVIDLDLPLNTEYHFTHSSETTFYLLNGILIEVLLENQSN
jgi:hypothetical protein